MGGSTPSRPLDDLYLVAFYDAHVGQLELWVEGLVSGNQVEVFRFCQHFHLSVELLGFGVQRDVCDESAVA